MGSRLRDKVCVVTGATSGIGRAMTRMFAAEGAAVAVVSIEADEMTATCAELDGLHARHVAMVGDVGDDALWASLAERLLGEFGRIDVLVNNAGFGLQGTVLDTSREEWDGVFETNVTGVYLGCRAVLPSMISHGRGSIVNIASVAGQIGMSRRAAYCATKAAVVGLTRAMAVDHAAQGVRVNAVLPGTTDTPYFSKIVPDVADPGEFRRQLADRQLLGRLGTPEEIASAAVFLASDESSFATGSLVTVDGGMSVW